MVRTCLDPVEHDEYRQRGYLRWGIECDGSEALLKPVGAVAGDRYAITEAGIVVNGELVPDTRPLRADNAGRSMHWAGEGVLAANEVLLVSRWPTSLDSRYFPVTTDRDRHDEAAMDLALTRTRPTAALRNGRPCCCGWPTRVSPGQGASANLALALLMPALWGLAPSRIAAGLCVFGYYAAASHGVPIGAEVFFQKGLGYAVALGLGASALSTLPWFLLFSRRQRAARCTGDGSRRDPADRDRRVGASDYGGW